MELLRNELKGILKDAEGLNLDHKAIAEELNYSYIYLLKIRAGEKPILDNEENKLLLKTIILKYREVIRKQINELDVTFKEVK